MRTEPRRTNFLAPALAAAAFAALVGCSPTMPDRITQSIGTLSEVQGSGKPVDPEVFRNARGVAIVDGSQWGLVISGQGGSGVLLRRTSGGWSAPCAITLTSMSLGLTIGGEGRSVVLVFETDEAVDAFVAKGRYFVARASGSFGDASGTTKEVSAGDRVHAYVVSSGCFASAALGGAGFGIDEKLNTETYGEGVTAWDILDGKVKPPVGQTALVSRLDRIIAANSGTASVAATPAAARTEATPPATESGSRATTRRIGGTPTGQQPDVYR
jgi:lipid-binding SYLF domain-containing protein